MKILLLTFIIFPYEEDQGNIILYSFLWFVDEIFEWDTFSFLSYSILLEILNWKRGAIEK